MRYQFVVLDEDEGKSALEVLLRRHHFSRVQAKKVRLYGELLVDGRPRRMKDPLAAGQKVALRYEAEDELPWGERIVPPPDIPILFQDEWFALACKPAGLLTHPSFLGERDSLITRLSPYRLHPVTRLDRETSGLILLAKSGQAHYCLSQSQIEKSYLGFCWGRPPAPAGRIEAPIARVAGSIIERRIHPAGKASLTEYALVESFAAPSTSGRTAPPYASLLRFRLHSGRTHQIRVHCRHAGCALIGDSLYLPEADARAALAERVGAERVAFLDRLGLRLGRQALHAHRLDFFHPYRQEWLRFSSELPAELAALREALVTGLCPEQ